MLSRHKYNLYSLKAKKSEVIQRMHEDKSTFKLDTVFREATIGNDL